MVRPDCREVCHAYISETLEYFERERSANRDIHQWTPSKNKGFTKEELAIIMSSVETFLSTNAVDYCRGPSSFFDIRWKYDTSHTLEEVDQLLNAARRNNATTFGLPFG